MSTAPWWRGAVIYQIYPRSFQDSNGDGIGDLPGIVDRLDYVASLGVDAIWISPFFRSPMADFGYDIADYRDVDPMFGTLADFDRLVARAHALGLKVIIDQVLSHTSAEHAWFKESRQGRSNAKADWYVWADPRPDGTPPNNWLSLFGGCAWQWEPRREQYYLHNFLVSQPDLNFHNPDVQQATLDNVRFWLERGVDGLRLDAINFCFHDRLLRDNPAKPVELRTGRGFSPDNPYAYQYHWHNNTQPENIGFLRRLRALMDEFGEVAALGEISSEDSLQTMAEYTGGDRLHMGYSFELLTPDFSAEHVRRTVNDLEAKVREGWPCWSISNHDSQRVVTRWGGESPPPHMAAMLSAMVCSLRGSVCVYQGEELGLPEAEIPFELLQDPYGIAFWPNFKGRDGCRTPLPWRNTERGGFTNGPAWLPVPAEHLQLSVETQEARADSPLQRFRQLMRFRQRQPALRWGHVRMLITEEPVLAFERVLEGDRLVCCFNLSAEPQTLALIEAQGAQAQEGHGLVGGVVLDGRIELPGYGAVFARR